MLVSLLCMNDKWSGELFCFLIWDYHQIKTTTTYNCYSTVFTTNSPTTLTSVKHWYWPGAVRGWWVEAIHQRWTPGIMPLFWCSALQCSALTTPLFLWWSKLQNGCIVRHHSPCPPQIVVCRYKQHFYYLFMFIQYSQYSYQLGRISWKLYWKWKCRSSIIGSINFTNINKHLEICKMLCFQ